jgi:hypothetical protein
LGEFRVLAAAGAGNLPPSRIVAGSLACLQKTTQPHVSNNIKQPGIPCFGGAVLTLQLRERLPQYFPVGFQFQPALGKVSCYFQHDSFDVFSSRGLTGTSIKFLLPLVHYNRCGDMLD